MNSKEGLEALDGLLLGDGNLTRYWNTAEYRMNQSRHTIPIEEHLKWEHWLKDNVFTALGIEASVKPCQADFSYKAKLGQGYSYAHLWTECSPLLVPTYNEWYVGGEWVKPSRSGRYARGATKIIPKRIVEAPELPIRTLVQWFLGDGGSQYHRQGVRVRFSTYCFTEDEVYNLMAKLDNAGIPTTSPEKRSHISCSGLRICLAQGGVNRFMDMVKPHILEIFGDSKSPTYLDMIKYRPEAGLNTGLSGLREKIEEGRRL